MDSVTRLSRLLYPLLRCVPATRCHLCFQWVFRHLTTLQPLCLIDAMKQFLRTLWPSPLKASLVALPATAIGIVVNRLSGPSGQVTLPAQTATDLLLLCGGILFSIGGIACHYWKRCQPSEKIESARKQDRPICHCTVDGVVMLVDPKKSDIAIWTYFCPNCGIRTLGSPASLQKRR